jgi:transcriptional regulator with XRE-family HTH domain
MANSRRAVQVVPHSVRSLAALTGVSHGTIGHILTGVQQSLDEEPAQRLAEALGCRLEDLFVPETSTIVDVDTDGEVHPNE